MADSGQMMFFKEFLSVYWSRRFRARLYVIMATVVLLLSLVVVAYVEVVRDVRVDVGC